MTISPQENQTSTSMPVLGAVDDYDDGYVSPDYDLASDSDAESEPPMKRARESEATRTTANGSSLAAEEQLVMQLLRSKR